MASEKSPTSRRTFLRGAAAATAAGSAIAVMNDLTGGITRAEARAATPAHDEQYLVDGLTAVTDNGVEVLVPPLYKYIITGKLRRDRTWDAKALKKAQSRFERALTQVEQGRARTAAGLTVVVAWGLPYFRTFIQPHVAKADWDAVWPRALDNGGAVVGDAVIDAVKFASDPRTSSKDGRPALILEDNEVMVMIRSDSPIILDDVRGQLFHNTTSDGYLGDIIDVTSERMGFVGRGFDKPSAAKQLLAKFDAGLAAKIPAKAQLMMGYTSTQTGALPPDNISSFETLGLTTVKPGDYFAGGAALHLSHIYEDLATWYAKGQPERAHRMFSPRADVAADVVTVPNGPGQVSSLADVTADAKKQPGGHNSLLQQATRLQKDVVDAYRKPRAKGTAVPAREDFNTLDAPFMTSSNPTRDRWSSTQNKPGLHFVVFVPASGRFHAARNAMDGVLPDGTRLGDPTTNGINDVLTTTHRQNYLVPPRTHRAFPMAELLP